MHSVMMISMSHILQYSMYFVRAAAAYFKREPWLLSAMAASSRLSGVAGLVLVRGLGSGHMGSTSRNQQTAACRHHELGNLS